MSYSDLYIKKKPKIPTLLGIAVLVGSIFFMARFFLTDIPFLRATPLPATNIQVANISPSGTTITWRTEQPTRGWVLYGTSENNISSIQIDDRDFQNKKIAYINHFVTLKTLRPNQKYFYKLVVNNQIVSASEDQPFEFTTLDVQTKVSNFPPAYGKVLQTNGAPLAGGVVVLDVPGAYPLATITKETGEWLIPLNYIVEESSTTIKTLSSNEPITITIFSEEKKISTIKTTGASLSPIPETIVIGSSYNFIEDKNVLAATASLPTPVPPKIEFTFPKKNPTIQAKNLFIKGFAAPNAQVTLEVNGPVKESIRVTADEFGVFRHQITTELKTGNYTITARAKDKEGHEFHAQESFAVDAVQAQVLASETSSTPTAVASASQKEADRAAAEQAAATPQVQGIGTGINPFAFLSVSLIILGAGLLLAF